MGPRADRKPVVLADNEEERERLQREREDNKRLKLIRMEKSQREITEWTKAYKRKLRLVLPRPCESNPLRVNFTRMR